MERFTTCSEITKKTDMTKEWGYSHIYKRLSEYEKTALAPAEIEALKSKLKKVEAERDAAYLEICRICQPSGIVDGMRYYDCGDFKWSGQEDETCG